jgi:hypothetical protein
MRAAAGVLALLLVWESTGAAEPARFRGYAEINQIVRQRLFGPGDPFQLGEYLEKRSAASEASLLDLLGTYKGDDLASTFKNGAPNPANMLLWHFLMASLARDVSKQCGGDSPLALRKDVRDAVMSACTWPAPAARAPDTLESLWTLVVGYDAPESELSAWKQLIQTSEFASSEEAVFVMMLTMTSNPYFLLGN